MTARENLRQMLSERRQFSHNSLDYQWRTRAARKYIWSLRGVPPQEWTQ